MDQDVETSQDTLRLDRSACLLYHLQLESLSRCLNGRIEAGHSRRGTFLGED